MTGELRTTPWSRAALMRLGIELEEVRARIPAGYAVHVSERRPNGPWYVRLFEREGMRSRELTKFSKTAPGNPDLGFALDYVIGMAQGAARGS